MASILFYFPVTQIPRNRLKNTYLHLFLKSSLKSVSYKYTAAATIAPKKNILFAVFACKNTEVKRICLIFGAVKIFSLYKKYPRIEQGHGCTTNSV